MKREGRQHGMVRTHCILPSSTLTPVVTLPRKASSIVGAPPTAGVFIRVPSKPTNHSKFTGKCRRPRCSSCHLHPSSKAKDKSKGSSKLRPSLANLGELVHDYTHHRGEEDEEEEEAECYDEIRVEEDDIGFYDVTLSLEVLDGEEGWSLVGEI